MPVTLEQAKLNTTDDLDLQVIDEFRKSSWLLDNLVFDDAVNPAGGGATLTYGYTRLITQPTAGFRAINSEYAPSEVKRARYTTDLAVLGGSFQIDRVTATLGPAASNDLALQMAQKIKAANATFSNAVINGDTQVDANSFDGLDKALTGSTTEITLGATEAGGDWGAVSDRAAGIAALKHLRKLRAKLNGDPSAFLMNADALAALETIADHVSQLGTLDAFGQTVQTWRGIPLIDLGDRAGSTEPVIATTEEGTTDIYAVRIGLDAFHGVSTTGGALVRQFLPNMTAPGAVKTGEVEMGPVGVALKATKAAAVLRGVKVAA
ncbi:major capsid protein [Streptomyces sp. CH6]|uniref:major capsid protein n=1 Tax=unclassified Streptomyces TaxID=2593676 RepID=UPI003D0155FD